METTEIVVRKITPAEGKWLTQVAVVESEERIFSQEIYLAVTDSAENWKEITEEEMNVLKPEDLTKK